MKFFQFSSLLIGIFVFIFSEIVYANDGNLLTRSDFIKLVISETFSEEDLKACSKENMPFRDVALNYPTASYICVAYENQFIKKSRKFRPSSPITLAESAAILKKAFNLEIPEYTPFEGTWSDFKDSSPWHQPYLLALQEQKAIPVSFWKPSDIMTQQEAKEMILRLKQKEITKSSMTFESLQSQKNRYRAKDLIRVSGDFTEALDAELLTQEILQLFREPGTYYIDDVFAAEQDYSNYCHNYYTQSGVRGSVAVIMNGDDVTIKIEALSTDYCVFPFPEMQPGECPPDVLYSDDPRCNRGQAKPYELILEKRGKQLFVRGTESNRIRITRAPIESLCREFADGCPAGYYDYTKVETTGTLSTEVTPKGEIWNVYQTDWKAIFKDLRGVPFVFFEKTFENGSSLQKYYEAPEHNRNPWGHGFVSYDDCLKDPVASFCIKRAGKYFVIASPYELGDRMTIWIDAYYRR